MPELPDVEAFRTVLDSCARGRRIERVEVYDAGVLRDVSERRLRRELEGRRFEEPARHGKWVLARTDGPTLLLHFGMTGRLLCCSPDDPRHAHDRVAVTVGGGAREGHRAREGHCGGGPDEGDVVRQVRYRDQRKLKGIWLTDEAGVARLLAGQGPDAATATRGAFDAALAGRRGGLKPALMDQSVLAGLGNLLVDEILWRARLHPERTVRGLTDDDRARLYAEMRRTLRAAVRAGRVPSRKSWLTGHRDEPGAACPRCGAPLCHGRVAGRGTVRCPRCQPRQS